MKTAIILILALLAGCAGQAGERAADRAEAGDGAGCSSMAPAAAADDAPAPRLERHEASAQCWMRYDKSGGSLDAKAKLVEKCINDKMAGHRQAGHQQEAAPAVNFTRS